MGQAFADKNWSRANKRKYRVIVVGTGLAGASAAATLGELGYNVDSFLFSGHAPARTSIAPSGINAPRTTQ